MRTAGRWLVVGWLLAALVVLGMDGRLPAFLAWATLGSLLVLGADALVRQQRRLTSRDPRVVGVSPAGGSAWTGRSRPTRASGRRPTAAGSARTVPRCGGT
jgi:hypothetical protein